MKQSDLKQLIKAQEGFNDAMVDYFKALKEIAYIEPNKEQYNTLTRQIEKLTKTIERIKAEGGQDEKSV